MPALPTRRIGNDDVVEMGLGLMGLSGFYGQVDSDEERFKVGDSVINDTQHSLIRSLQPSS